MFRSQNYHHTKWEKILRLYVNRVIAAREIQAVRFKELEGIHANPLMNSRILNEIWMIDKVEQNLLKAATEKLYLSARAYDRILKVSRSIADIIMAAKKESAAIPQENLDHYNNLVATNPKIERKGSTGPYTSCTGHMFSYLEKDGSLGLLLPPDLLEELHKKYKTTLFMSHGVIKKEYALVPDKLLKNTKELKPYFDGSCRHVLSLKPKPGRKVINESFKNP